MLCQEESTIIPYFCAPPPKKKIYKPHVAATWFCRNSACAKFTLLLKKATPEKLNFFQLNGEECRVLILISTKSEHPMNITPEHQ